MSDVAIRVDGLGKWYRIGTSDEAPYGTIAGMRRLFTSPFAYLRRMTRPPTDAETFWALKDVSFEIQRGEVVGVIGRNGAGKSTLLKILSRITDPSAGRAEVHGRVGSLLEVGTGFHPELTGRENVYLNGAILGMRRADIARRFDEIVGFADIDQFLDTPVKRYSSGMYVRLAFAVAAHLEPEILLMDEVLAVGDAEFQKKCLGKLSAVARDGRTVVLVSHNMPAITQLCRRAIWLDEGALRTSGLPNDVVKSYLAAHMIGRAERSWTDLDDAPGDDRVRLLGCQVVQDDHAAQVIDINEPFSVGLDFEVLRPVRNLITGINLYDASGLCLFASCDWRESRLHPGRYRKLVHAPAQLLAEGTHSVLVQLVFYDPDVKSVVLPEAMTFEAMDSDHPCSVRGQYKEKWPGVMRVNLHWADAVPHA